MEFGADVPRLLLTLSSKVIERDQEVVVYRNALFKGTKALHPGSRYTTLAQFMELEQADGQTVFVGLISLRERMTRLRLPYHRTRPSQ